MGIMGKAPIVHVRHLGTVSEAIDTFVRVAQKTNPAFVNVDRNLMRLHFEVRSRELRQTRHFAARYQHPLPRGRTCLR